MEHGYYGYVIISLNLVMDDKSILDIIEENFKAIERRNYVHRIVYAADHSLKGDDPKITDILAKNIQKVNEEYCDEPLTGFCLNYNKHFIHLLDGSEHSIMKHLKCLIECEQVKDKLGKMKLLVIYNHINQRFFQKWGIRTAVPPTLLGQSSLSNDFEAISNYVKAVIIKFYNLATHLYNTSPSKKVGMGEITAETFPFLPEVQILDILLDSPFVLDLREYAAGYLSVPESDAYEELIWPISCDFVPLDVFDKLIEPIEELTDVLPV